MWWWGLVVVDHREEEGVTRRTSLDRGVQFKPQRTVPSLTIFNSTPLLRPRHQRLHWEGRVASLTIFNSTPRACVLLRRRLSWWCVGDKGMVIGVQKKDDGW